VDYTLLGFVGDRDPRQPGLSQTRQLRLRVSAGAPGSRLPSGGQIRRHARTECRKPSKARGARKQAATLSKPAASSNYEFNSGLVPIHDNSYYSRACAFCPVLVQPVSDEFLW
jgi:hypothetical protein